MGRHQLKPGGAHGPAPAAGRTQRRVIAVVLVLAVVAVLIGAVALWPRHRVHGTATHRDHATVTRIVTGGCPVHADGCDVTDVVRLLDGPQAGQTQNLTFVRGATDAKLKVGQRISMDRQGTGRDTVYAFADVDRGRPVLLLAVVFIVIAVAIGRRRGVAALAGLVFAGATLLWFTIPALVEGRSPTAVALVTGAAICLVSLPVAHGVSQRAAVAVIGSQTGMAVAAVIVSLSVSALHFTGLSSDESAYLASLGSRSTVSGLLLCGTVVGAIGVLNDVTVTQASAVFEIAAAAPDMHRPALVRAATRIGRDHIAATIYSLVLAYAGASLPLLLLFSVTNQSVTTVLTSDAFAPEVVSGLIGATALVLVVPFTTVLAAVLVTAGRGEPPDAHHGHGLTGNLQ